MTPRFYETFVLIAFAFLAIVILSMSYAFASSNNVYPNTGGDGLGSISGYVITEVSYHLAQDSSRVDSVSFSLNAPATFVRIQLTDTQTQWSSCTHTGDNRWTCDTSVPLSDVNQLRVIAGGN